MECMLCGNETVEVNLSVRRHVQGKVIEFRNVPGTECKNVECSIQTFDSLVIERLDNISNSIDLSDWESGYVEYDSYKNYDEWQKEFGITIMDPDGFRGLSGSWWEPNYLFSRKEFERHLIRCTYGTWPSSRGIKESEGVLHSEDTARNLKEVRKMVEEVDLSSAFPSSVTAEAVRRHVEKYLGRLVPNSECKVETTSVDGEKGIVQLRITVPKWFAERMDLDEQGEAKASSGEEAE